MRTIKGALLEGNVIGQCVMRRRSQEYLRFLPRIDRETPPHLDLNVIADNDATHESPTIKGRLARQPPAHLLVRTHVSAKGNVGHRLQVVAPPMQNVDEGIPTAKAQYAE